MQHIVPAVLRSIRGATAEYLFSFGAMSLEEAARILDVPISAPKQTVEKKAELLAEMNKDSSCYLQNKIQIAKRLLDKNQ